MNAIGQLALAGMLLAVAPHAVRANPETCEQESFSEAQPSSACPRLFGDRQRREQNRKLREGRSLSVRRGKYCNVVLHSTDWRKPRPVDYNGLVVLRTRIDEESGPQALVSVSDEIEELGCKPGLYIIEVDDSVGDDAHVLAIVGQVVLIEDDGKLRYIEPDGVGRPVWRMIWKSPWSIPRLPDSSRRVSSPHGRRSKGHSRFRRGRRR
ncbi:MAG TPA: hypothetical protein VM425_02935 [Myxococcota bacterium]|nr:hypothetical protein [Myxococcota bacterium]